MKSIVKGAEPQAFKDWKDLANQDWQPAYENLQNPQKKAVHEALLNEQCGVCCYCGRRITRAESHIEHFRPQEARKDLELDFRNLHASCIRESEPGNPLHCGHAKGNDFDEKKCISPLDPGCEARFSYALDGAIYATNVDDQAARYMSELLQLDIEFLRNRREDAIRKVFDSEFLATASDEDLEKLVVGYRLCDEMHPAVDFGHSLARFAEQLLGK